jgi:His Kinase A (phospho-acceptor) domain
MAKTKMRFDDRLETMLAMETPDKAARSAVWCQIADLLAQSGGQISREVGMEAMARLRSWRMDVARTRRRGVSTALAQHRPDRNIVGLFGEDEADVAAPILARAVLDDDQWIELIPGFPPASRALLRERRDLGATVRQLLSAYGPSDFALPPGVAIVAGNAGDPTTQIQIRDLVARIEAYRNSRPVPEHNARHEDMQRFRFESREDGQIVRVEGVQAAPLIGISLADLAPPRMPGIDGQAAGAFRQRAPFANARMKVAGTSDASGDWIVSGKPIFNPDNGRFLGYRGIGRRPSLADGEAARNLRLLDDGFAPDSVRQLVHELRTPLNAIRGFSDMIGAQVLGPVSYEYRRRADDVSRDALRLAAIFDDLETAAKLDTQSYESDRVQNGDAGEILRRLAGEFRSYTDQRDLLVKMSVPTDIPHVAIGPADLGRLLGRYVAAIIGSAGPGETVEIALRHADGVVACDVQRPLTLTGLDVDALRQSMIAADAENEDAPALGFGFSVRLVEALASTLGGGFSIGAEQFSLLMPAARVSAEAIKENR